MDDIIDIVVGFDEREAVAYHTFTQSVIEKSSVPTRFLPLSTKSLSTGCSLATNHTTKKTNEGIIW